MARNVFFSFSWDDNWKAFQIRNIWVTKGYFAAGYRDTAQVEQIKRTSPREIQKWIDQQLYGTSVTCVLIGRETYKSRWVNYEIEKSLLKGNALLGVNLYSDALQGFFNPHSNPFSAFRRNEVSDPLWGTNKLLEGLFNVAPIQIPLTDVVKVYSNQSNPYGNLGLWIEESFKNKDKYGRFKWLNTF